VDAKDFGWRAWYADLAAATQFLTRLPRLGRQDRAFELSRGARVLPLVGAAIGAAIGAGYWLFLVLHVPSFAAAAFALAVGAVLTGGLHEDGLADTADGFGGGQTVSRKLEIMDDSRIGAYGVLALIFVTAIKIGCLGTLPGPRGLMALITAHALARTALPFVAYVLPNAKSTGLAVSAGRPSAATLAIAGILGVAIVASVLPIAIALASIAVIAALALAVLYMARRQIGGYTGDVLGAAEQLGEALILLIAAAWH